MGVHRVPITHYENGVYSPHASDLPRLARILGVPITYFFEEDEPPHDAQLPK
jgi:transcriptional regulator with XRE-family HTH domain